MGSLFRRIVHQMLNDRRSLALIFFAPLIMTTLLYFLLGPSSYEPRIAYDNVSRDFAKALGEQQAFVTPKVGDGAYLNYFREHAVDAIVYKSGQQYVISMVEPDSVKTPKVTEVVQDAMKELNPAIERMGIEVHFLYGDTDASVFDSLGYVLLSVLSFFFVFMISGISFVRERTTGTLERLMLTPIKAWEVAAGYTLGLGVFAAGQSVLLILFTKFVLNMSYAAEWYPAIFVMLLLAFVAVSFGALVSIFAHNEFQVVQFIPIIIVPQIFFSGLITLDTLPFGLGNLAYLTPIYYGAQGMKDVVNHGLGLSEMGAYLIPLALILLGLFALNTFIISRYRSV